MKKTITLLFLSALLGQAAYADVLENSTQIDLNRSWSQEPGGWSWAVDISVPDTMPEGGYPVCVLLHGADTGGGTLLGGFRDVLPDHALVAPNGYQQSWNICREVSKARLTLQGMRRQRSLSRLQMLSHKHSWPTEVLGRTSLGLYPTFVLALTRKGRCEPA